MDSFREKWWMGKVKKEKVLKVKRVKGKGIGRKKDIKNKAEPTTHLIQVPAVLASIHNPMQPSS